MNATPYSGLARQFMELWQKQMASVLSDREFIQSMLELMQSMQTSGNIYTHANPDTAASDPALSPAAQLERLDQLEYRYRQLEKRIFALEDAFLPPRGSAGRPARRRPRGSSRSSHGASKRD